LGEPVYVSPDSVNGSIESEPVFAGAGEKRALLLRMGSGPRAWVYLDTLARAAGITRHALSRKLEALEQEGFVASTNAPAGPRYQLTEDGRRLRAGSAPADDERGYSCRLVHVVERLATET
jgi:DNA-binding MarR family transcriptional regulator